MTAKELKASILDLAIRGKLVPQDPNDEPAENLLACIAAEKVKLAKSGKLKKERLLPLVTDEDMPFVLPRGWVWCRLGNIVSKPITYGIIKLGREDSHGVNVLRCSDVKTGYVEADKVRTVTKELSNTYSRTILSGGEVVINVRGTLGGCAYIDKRFAGYNVSREVAVISGLIDGRYLMWCLLSNDFWKYMMGNLQGIAYKGLNIGLLVRFPVPIPPLAEQKRIVEKIEQLMPLVERYGQAEEKRWQLIATLPEALKKSILKSAFDTGFDAACVFEENVLEDVCADVFTGNSLSDAEKRRFATDTGLPFIGTKNVGFDQVVDYDNGMRIPASENKYRTAAAGSSLLCVEGGSSGRKIALLDRDVRFGNKLCAFVPSKGVDAHYLFLFLQSPQFLKQFTALQNGPRKGAGVSQIKKLKIRYVPLAEQKRIVARVEELLGMVAAINV